ncbi:hypothetical protein YC2023_023647 [Brassica napus]
MHSRVVKPSELTPLTALAATEFALRCCIYCKKVSLELGGNAPSIIFDDADLDVAVKATVSDSHENSGQTCVCANRVLVQDGTAHTPMDLASIQKLEVGDGFKEGTPRSTYKRCINSKGSHSYKMLFPTKEIFGPVAPLIRFITEKEAVRIANDTIAGNECVQDLLLIYSQTVSNDRGVSLKHLRTGLIWSHLFDVQVAPLGGGVKQSGLGKEGSKYGLDEYLEGVKQSGLGKEGSKYGLDEYLEVTQNTHHMNTL